LEFEILFIQNIMKTNYSTPEIEVILISLEDGACTTASNTENFEYKEGSWN